MQIPVMRGVIDRRILANYRVAPERLQRILPAPFRPQLIDGWGIAGICLIRLKQIRPRFLPLAVGFASENAAHRIAVEWDENGEVRHGVYVPRRDTSSRLNVFAGGRIFPGVHHHACFDVHETPYHLSVLMKSDDGESRIAVEGNVTQVWSPKSVFDSLQTASAFFESGSLGYSATATPGRYDGLELRTLAWNVEPLALERIQSSFFDDAGRFPAGSVEFDCALLMRGIQHEWHGRAPLCACEQTTPARG